MMSVPVFVCLFFTTLASAAQCTNIQLGGPSPCVYSTSECLKGTVQWNYPTKTCQWTFAPKGASSVQLSALWATASYVNLTFYDGTNPNTAKRIGFVGGGREDERKINVSSSTGVVFVKLQGPPTMMTYALIFEYSLNAKIEQCGVHDGDCEACLAAGCSMFNAGTSCVPMCPTDSECWSAATANPAAVCTHRQTIVDTARRCAAQPSCSTCLEAQCRWGGVVGSPPACMATCGPMQRCSFAASCPAKTIDDATPSFEPAPSRTCDAQTTCEGCIDAGCSLMGLEATLCANECYSDIPCFTPSPSKTTASICKERTEKAVRAAMCKSKADCSGCLAAGCSWNSLGAQGDKCITGCGFFPCELKSACGGDDVMRVGGERSTAFKAATSGSVLLSILLIGGAF